MKHQYSEKSIGMMMWEFFVSVCCTAQDYFPACRSCCTNPLEDGVSHDHACRSFQRVSFNGKQSCRLPSGAIQPKRFRSGSKAASIRFMREGTCPECGNDLGGLTDRNEVVFSFQSKVDQTPVSSIPGVPVDEKNSPQKIQLNH